MKKAVFCIAQNIGQTEHIVDQGALKNQVQHPDRVWCCDGKTLRTIEA
jgi:hypothetical protein